MTKQKGLKKVNYFGYGDEVMLEPTRRWLAEEAKEPFFAAYLTNTTHHPYGTPPGFEKREFAPPGRFNDYLNSIRSTDEVLERLVRLYRDAGVWERTVFIVVGDHGEAFGEHGMRLHDNIMYDEGLRVPLVIRAPGQAGTSIPGPLNQLAIVPTALDLLGYDIAEGSYVGSSIFQRPVEPSLFSTCYQSALCAATIRGDKKLIYYFGDRPPLLFDLSSDSQERRNIAADFPAEVDLWSRETVDWKLAVRETHRDSGKPMLSRYVRDSPQPVDHPMRAVFGGFIELRGYTLKKRKVRRERRLKIHYFFKVLKPIPPRYRLRVRGSAGWQERRYNHVPVRGLYPLREWRPGEYIEDVDKLKVRSSWRADSMDLCMELVDEQERPVPVTGDVGETCVSLGSIEVLPRAD
jgi:hypothetical protein